MRGMDLADVAAELYALLPAEFTAARNRRAKDAKSEGHPLLAKQVARLPKPTASAWAVNVMARQHPEELEPVLELGAAMRDAQEMLDAERLRGLGQQRTGVLAAAVRGARSAADALGVAISDAAAGEIEQTLRAAMGDADAAAAVRSGLLVRPFASGGFGPADLSGAVAVPGAVPGAGASAGAVVEDGGGGHVAGVREPTERRAPAKVPSRRAGSEKAKAEEAAADGAAAEEAKAREATAEAARVTAEAAEARRLEAEAAEARREAKREAEEARRRERNEAQAGLAEAEEALAAAEAELEDAERQSDEAAARRESIEGELAALRRRVAELENDLEAAEREEGLAGRARRLAARVAEQERRAVARARERLERLS